MIKVSIGCDNWQKQLFHKSLDQYDERKQDEILNSQKKVNLNHHQWIVCIGQLVMFVCVCVCVCVLIKSRNSELYCLHNNWTQFEQIGFETEQSQFEFFGVRFIWTTGNGQLVNYNHIQPPMLQSNYYYFNLFAHLSLTLSLSLTLWFFIAWILHSTQLTSNLFVLWM